MAGRSDYLCQRKGWLRTVKEGEQVRPGPWEHRPAATAHSTPSTTLRCTLLLPSSYLHFTTSWLAVTVQHTTPHWWPPAGPLPSLHLQSVQRTSVSHLPQCGTAVWKLFEGSSDLCLNEKRTVWSVDQPAICGEVCPPCATVW